ncbi:MAG: succinylglutamate desuccinylase/aspartoacylase family protein [Oscillospiraceae bacterium]|nr:succinylglutamate desuccinylase/aspartoacylase family protein [Oscillospiraceae bacterium]
MKKEILYSIKSPYREPLDIIGFRFGSGSPSLAVVGAMRGNEVQQMYVCARLVRELKKLEKKHGIAPGKEILVIPCVNYYSMNIGKRFWTMDNTDINHMFPGYDLGETTQRIADGVFSQIKDYEYGIQMASFYQQGDFLPHVKIMKTDFAEPELMSLFGMRYGIVRTPRPYDTTTLNFNWQIWETKAFSVYTNATDVIDESSADDAVEAILRFMNNAGIITGKIHPGYRTEVIPESGIEQIRTESAGIFRSMTRVGAHVEENEILGKILDPLDCEENSYIRASAPGVVFFEFNKPLIDENTVCFKLIKD